MRRAALVGLLVGLWALWPCMLAGQIFDSLEEPFITKSDSVNERLQVLKGFQVVIRSPELMTNSGIKLKYGFDTWVLHVVGAKDIRINGAQLDNRGEMTYVAVIVKQTPEIGEVDLEADSLGGRALFFKAIVAGDNIDAKVEFYTKLAKKYDAAADSFTVLVDSLFMVEPAIKRQRDDYRLMAGNCRFTAEAYEEFARVGEYGDDVARFFLSHYMNFSDQINIHTQPFGLPEILPPPKTPEPGGKPAPAPVKRKSRFWRKLAFWK